MNTRQNYSPSWAMGDIQTTLSIASKQLIAYSESPLLDAEVLLCHILKKSRSHLRAWPEKQLDPNQTIHFQKALNQRLHGTPIAYITGNREFWSRNFKVTPDVLIPRPDTELLVELSLQLIENKTSQNILELGTGSGIIAITLARERPDIAVIATDISIQALEIAKINARTHKAHNIHFIQSNWLDNTPLCKYNLIISNPPYIDHNDPHLLQGDVRFEPKIALTAKDHGLEYIKTICNHARKHLTPNGKLLIEHGFDQQTAVQKIFNSFTYTNIETHADLFGNPRVTMAQNQY